MNKSLILAGIMVAVFLMPVAASAKKVDAPGQLKKDGTKQSAKNWANGQNNCEENQGKKGNPPGQVNNGPAIGPAIQMPAPQVFNSSQSSKSQGCGNPGAIWTVNSPDVQQDVNHYLRGESV